MSFTAAAGFTTCQRFLMFNMICIPLRLSLSALVYHFGSHSLARSAVVVSGLTVFLLQFEKDKEFGAKRGLVVSPSPHAGRYKHFHFIHHLFENYGTLCNSTRGRTIWPGDILLQKAIHQIETSPSSCSPSSSYSVSFPPCPLTRKLNYHHPTSASS